MLFCLSLIHIFQALGRELGVEESPYEGERDLRPIDVSESLTRDPNKCILCRRCVSVCNKIQTTSILTAENRGFQTVITPAFGPVSYTHLDVYKRQIEECVDEEISLGDFVLTGGEIPAMAVADAVCRLVPGVLSDAACFTDESHWDGLLEYPQYSRPEVWHDRRVQMCIRDRP